MGRGGRDRLAVGEDGGASLWGEGGNDILNPYTGSNDVDGGEGRDLISFCEPFGGTNFDVAIDLGSGSAFSVDDEGELDADVTVANVEDALGCGGNDVLTGDPGANLLIGYDRADEIDGAAGDDAMHGDDAPVEIWNSFDFTPPIAGRISGTDTIMGGPGDDLLRGGPKFDELDGG